MARVFFVCLFYLKGAYSLGQALQRIMNHHVGAGNQTRVFCGISKCF